MSNLNLTSCCRIPYGEVMSLHWLSGSQATLFALQERGAPVEGNIYFSIKDGYDWKKVNDDMSGDVMFSWGISK